MRIAWFSPLPPERSGIAAYSAELLPLLAPHHAIEVFIDDAAGARAIERVASVPGVHVRGAHDFPWRQAAGSHDVVVYQLGNDSCHNYMWPYLVRYPGLVVVHDAQLHQSRAWTLLNQRRADDYRAEFRFDHPEAPPELPEIVIAGLGQFLSTLYYQWPMLRLPVEAARVVAVHNAYLQQELATQFPSSVFRHIRQGSPDVTTAALASPADVRARHRIPQNAVVFAAFGRVTPEKRLTAVLQALSEISRRVPYAHLLCVGDTMSGFDLVAEARQMGQAERITVTGYVPDSQLPEYLAAADVCLCLRWPTGRETSGAWIRCLAAGKATVVTNLAHTADVPCLDPRSWQLAGSTGRGGGERQPIGVMIDLLDEVNMLAMALQRLAQVPDLRTALGAAARQYWANNATLEIMAGDYETALELTARAPSPARTAWPPHVTNDGGMLARQIAERMGVSVNWLG
jgi:glycosyltransferase involved in cell wall biosynthesis